MEESMSVVPAGGWVYAQKLPNGNYYYFHKATLDEVIEAVRTFRVNLDIEVGDIEQEIKDYFKARQPRQPTDERSLREKVTGWKAQIQFQPHELVTPEEAERRANICNGCPFNESEWGDDCVECVSHVKQDLYAIRKGQETQTPVGACMVLGQDNRTSVWLPESSLRRRSAFKDKLPDFCWVKNLDSKPSPEEIV